MLMLMDIIWKMSRMFHGHSAPNSADQQSCNPDDHMGDVIGIRHESGHHYLTAADWKVQASQDPGEDLWIWGSRQGE